MAHPELNAVLNDLLPFAQRMLADQSEFYPFGASITSDGRHQRRRERRVHNPKSRGLIDIMTAEFRRQAAAGKIRAAGICFDVRVLPTGQVDKTDAIQLALEREGEAVDIFVPYAELSDREFTYGELFACQRARTLFIQQHERA